MSQSIADLVRTQRQAAGLSRNALASCAGLAPMTVSNLETGRIRNPSINTLGRLARRLNLSGEAVAAVVLRGIEED